VSQCASTAVSHVTTDTARTIGADHAAPLADADAPAGIFRNSGLDGYMYDSEIGDAADHFKS
jgi:hypothetical protein